MNNALTRAVKPAGAARVLFGAAIYASPAKLGKLLGVDAATAQRTAWIARYFAGRDLALGAGILAGSRTCQWAAAVSDLGDCVATVAALRAGQVKRGPGLLTVGMAAFGAVAGGASVWAARS